MKMKIEGEILPFDVPDFVHIRIGDDKAGQPVTVRSWFAAHTPETLAALCDGFRAEVFRKAGKEEPPPPPRRGIY